MQKDAPIAEAGMGACLPLAGGQGARILLEAIAPFSVPARIPELASCWRYLKACPRKEGESWALTISYP